jgi:hypothetical protein
MCSGAVIYLPSCTKIGSGVQKLMRGGYTHTHRQQRDLISLLYFSKYKSRLIILINPYVIQGCVIIL